MEKVSFHGSLHLVIGDEWYFDRHPSLIFEKEFKDVDIDVMFFTEHEGHVPVAQIIIKPTGEDTIFQIEGDQVAYPKSRRITALELGCDTASYLFNDFEVSTMADGFYGIALYQKIGRHAYIEVTGGFMAETYDDFKNIIIAGIQQNIKGDGLK